MNYVRQVEIRRNIKIRRENGLSLESLKNEAILKRRTDTTLALFDLAGFKKSNVYFVFL